jgi:hypothetical protein
MCGSLALPSAAQVKETAPPALPHLDHGACPGELCRYGRWTMHDAVPLYDKWQRRRRRIGQIRAGETVSGLTGFVITARPGVIRIDRDLPEHSLTRGDIILTYAYRGEGFSAVWFHGRYYSDFDISFTKWPNGMGCGGAHCAATYQDLGEKTWWARVQQQSGRTGWVDMTGAVFEIGPLDHENQRSRFDAAQAAMNGFNEAPPRTDEGRSFTADPR